VPEPAAAQINIERLRLQADSLGLHGAASVAVSIRTGNADTRRGDVDGRVDYVWPDHQLFAVGRGAFDWTEDVRISNEGLLHLRLTTRRRDRVSPEAFTQANYDRSRLLDWRGLLGGGVRVGLAEGENARVALGVGYMFEREELDLELSAEHPTETSHHRLTSYLTASVEPREGVAIASTAYVQPRLDAWDDVRILGQNRLAVSILGPLTLDVTFDLGYDARPPDGTESLDTTLRTGIGVTF